MPNNPKDVLSTESQNPKPKGPFGYSGNSVLGKVADLFANHAIFGDMKSREVRGAPSKSLSRAGRSSRNG